MTDDPIFADLLVPPGFPAEAATAVRITERHLAEGTLMQRYSLAQDILDAILLLGQQMAARAVARARDRVGP
jgi:hypothetical protein